MNKYNKKAPPTYRNGDMVTICPFCNKRGGRHKLGCQGFTPEPRYNEIAQDYGDDTGITFS
jgi:hypothetical protein